MATKLDKPLKREIEVAGKPYMLTIAPLVSGEAALAAALNASLQR